VYRINLKGRRKLCYNEEASVNDQEQAIPITIELNLQGVWSMFHCGVLI